MTSLSGTATNAPTTIDDAGRELDARTPAIAAAVAATICLAIAVVGWQVAPEGWVVGMAGLPATTCLAWRMGPGVARSSRGDAIARAFVLAIATILITEALVIVGLFGVSVVGVAGSSSLPGAADLATGFVSVVAWALIVFVYGAVIVGIPVAIVVLPAALVWAALVRHIAGRLA